MKLRLPRVPFLAAPCLAVLFAPLAVAQWPEPGGLRSTRAVADVDAPRVAPVERWRHKADAVLSEPVVEGGAVYAIVRVDRKERLVGIDLETGQEVVGTKFKAEGFAAVSVQGTRLVVTSGDGLRSFERQGERLKKGRVARGAFRTPASIFGGMAAAVTDDGLRVVQLKTGKTIVESPADIGKPLVLPVGDDEYMVMVSSHRESVLQEPFGKSGTYIGRYVDRWLVQAASTRKPEIKRLAESDLRRLRHFDDLRTELIQVRGRRQGQTFFVLSDWAGPLANDRALLRLKFLDRRPTRDEVEAVRDPCVAGQLVFGRDRGGRLFVQRVHEKARQLMVPAERPDGAVDGPISCAAGVLLMGNWALDLRTSKFLWVAEDLDFDGTLVPAADGVVVYRSTGGDLVCADDGRDEIAAVTREESGAVVARADEANGESHRVVLDARAALADAFHADLLEVFEGYASRDLLIEGRRVLDELAERGIPEGTIRELDRRLTGRSESVRGNRDKQLAAVQAQEAKARDTAVDRAIAWAVQRAPEGSGEAVRLEAGAVLYWALGTTDRRTPTTQLRRRVSAAAEAIVPRRSGSRRGRFAPVAGWSGRTNSCPRARRSSTLPRSRALPPRGRGAPWACVRRM